MAAARSDHVQAQVTTVPPNVEEELDRIGKNIRRHSQALSRDMAQMRDLMGRLGISVKFTTAPPREYDHRKDQTR